MREIFRRTITTNKNTPQARGTIAGGKLYTSATEKRATGQNKNKKGQKMNNLDIDALNQCADFIDAKAPQPVLNSIFVVDLPDQKRLYAATTGQIVTAIITPRTDNLPNSCVRIVNYKKKPKKETGRFVALDTLQQGQDYDAAQEWEKMRGILPKTYGGLCKTEYERATCYKVFNPDFTKKVLKYAGLNTYTDAGKVYLGDAADILAPQIWENGDMFIEIMPMRQF